MKQPRVMAERTPTPTIVAPFLAGGGACGRVIRSIDWSKTVLGPISGWPSSLVSTVGIVLHSRHPMFLWWGPDLIQFYNDAYLPSFGRGKHPAAMGQKGSDCWQEIWPIIWPQIDDVMARARPSWNEDALVPIFRNDRIEEVYWTYGYSPVFDDDGSVGGTLVVCTETTTRVIANRRSQLVQKIGDVLAACTDLAEIPAALRQATAEAIFDLPFLATYRRDPATREWHASGTMHLDDDDLDDLDAAVRSAIPKLGGRGVRPVEIGPLDAAWPEPVTTVVVMRPETPGVHVLVFGVSPRLPLDATYQAFLEQIVEQIDLAAARLETFRMRAAVESERRNLLLQAPVATALMTGPRHVFEVANDLYMKMVGRDVIGKAYLDAFPEIAGTPLAGILDRVYLLGEPFVAEEYLVPLDRTGSGTLEDCTFRFNLEPIRNADGSVFGMMAIAVDITEQVNARRALERTTLEREKILGQLERANHAKDEFLATVSHELRTPLTSILGWARLLSDASDPLRIQKGLVVIERNARAQVQLIEDILDISRIISGKTRMNMRRVDPAAAVNAAVETIRPAATAKQIRLDIDIDPTVGLLVADEDRLQQIVWNLLSNAVKFTGTDGEVQVRVGRRESDVVISVRDTGKGIAQAFLPHVFDRFRQDDTSTTKQQAGLGLGLAIVRHLVELHGGRIRADSDGEGRGASFEVILPIRAVQPADESALPVPRTSAELPGEEPSRLRGVHILVVDDQTDARELVATVLSDFGALVSQAESVSAALAVLATEDIAIIVSDIGMPGEDGYSLLQRLRTSEAAVRSRAVPALALTAYARPEDRHMAIAAGFQEHVAKPIDPLMLVEMVASLLRA